MQPPRSPRDLSGRRSRRNAAAPARLDGPAGNAPARVRGGIVGRWWRAALVCVLCGCHLRPRPAPASAAVVSCREFSQKALADMQRGRWSEAEKNLRQAVTICPVDSEARGHYADVLRRQGKTSEAMMQLREAIELLPHDAGLHLKAADTALALGDPDEALKFADRAIDLDAARREGWILRGQIMERAGRSPQALSDYYRALRNDPAQPEVLLRIAALHTAVRRPERALLVLQEAEDLHPAGAVPAEIKFRQALAYDELGRLPEATECAAAACGRDSRFVEAHYLLAALNERQGRYAEADAALARVFETAPGHPGALALRDRLRTARAPSAPLFK